MLSVIDAIAERLRRAGRCAEAIDAALVAVTADPLRDSSQAALITAHLGEGNLCEARRAYAAYRTGAERRVRHWNRRSGWPASSGSAVEPTPQLRPTARRRVLAMA